MTKRESLGRARSYQRLVGFLIVLAIQFGCASTPADESQSTTETATTTTTTTAEDGETSAPGDTAGTPSSTNGSGRLEPRYQPREPVPDPWYNSNYIFGMTRGVADSTIAPAGKAPLFFLTVPLDIAFLPFTLIGGLF